MPGKGVEFTNRQTWAGKYRGSYFTQRSRKHGWRRVLFCFYTTCKQKRYIKQRFKAKCIGVTCIITMIEWVIWKSWIFESHNFGKWKNYLLEHSIPLHQPSPSQILLELFLFSSQTMIQSTWSGFWFYMALFCIFWNCPLLLLSNQLANIMC